MRYLHQAASVLPDDRHSALPQPAPYPHDPHKYLLCDHGPIACGRMGLAEPRLDADSLHRTVRETVSSELGIWSLRFWLEGVQDIKQDSSRSSARSRLQDLEDCDNVSTTLLICMALLAEIWAFEGRA